MRPISFVNVLCLMITACCLAETKLELNYSSFLGGSADDNVIKILLDKSGNAIVLGETSSHDFPTTENAYNRYLSGESDIFIAKINIDKGEIVYSTFLGGKKGRTTPHSMALDTAGNLWVAGVTTASDYPVTDNAYDKIYNGGSHNTYGDFVLSKLDFNGNLLYATYIGGSKWELACDMAINRSGDIYIFGCSNSVDFPLTENAIDTISSPDTKFQEFILCKFNSSGQLLFSSYLGGSSSEHQARILVDKNENIILTGRTMSEDFPVTTDAYDTSFNGPDNRWGGDLSLTIIDPTHYSIIYSTFIGSNNREEWPNMIQDTEGNIFVVGMTESDQLYVNNNGFDSTYNGNRDVIVFKVDCDKHRVINSTFLGGSNDEGMYGNCIEIDEQSKIYVTKTTKSTDFPVTPDAYDSTFNGGESSYGDVYLSVLDKDLSTLIYSTYIGGKAGDNSDDIVVHDNDIYIVGVTKSDDFPTTKNAIDKSFNGGRDGFILKFVRN